MCVPSIAALKAGIFLIIPLPRNNLANFTVVEHKTKYAFLFVFMKRYLVIARKLWDSGQQRFWPSKWQLQLIMRFLTAHHCTGKHWFVRASKFHVKTLNISINQHPTTHSFPLENCLASCQWTWWSAWDAGIVGSLLPNRQSGSAGRPGWSQQSQSIGSHPQPWLIVLLRQKQQQGWKEAYPGESILFWKYHASLFPIPIFFPINFSFVANFKITGFVPNQNKTKCQNFPWTRNLTIWPVFLAIIQQIFNKIGCAWWQGAVGFSIQLWVLLKELSCQKETVNLLSAASRWRYKQYLDEDCSIKGVSTQLSPAESCPVLNTVREWGRSTCQASSLYLI